MTIRLSPSHAIMRSYLPVCTIAALMLSICSAGAQDLPTDVDTTCTAPYMRDWFKNKEIQLNGVVQAANSVGFPKKNNNCDFYNWSEQMFLWLTSPAPPEYGGGTRRIYASPAFFSVSPPDASGQRTFIPNDPSTPFGSLKGQPIGVRNLQKAAGGRLIVFTKSGEIAAAEPAPVGAKPTIRNASGATVEIAHASLLASGALVLKNAQDTAIQLPPRTTRLTSQARAAREHETIPTLTLKKFVVDHLPIFIDPEGNVVDVEPGQAGGNDVLLAQNGSLVYYTISTNDVYAYFLTGVAGGAINTGNVFPTRPADLVQIVDFAKSKGVIFPDPRALTVEIKAAWIEAANLSNLDSYLTVQATIPVYQKTSASVWKLVPGASRVVTLALVGMHVVGSVYGHPEMVWATFEHVANDPRGAYQYINKQKTTVSVSAQSDGPWTFAATMPKGPFNVAHQTAQTPGIVATPYCNNDPVGTMLCKISPSDTMHLKAFGAAYGTSPNPEDKTAAASNTEIVSINNSVRGQLANGDVRGNYILTGATWTQFGAVPSNTNQIGTSMLANSTMETYQQGQTNADASTNCFTCHSNTLPNPPFKSCGTDLTTCVSHVFAYINPLR